MAADFFDSNVLLYLASEDVAKADRAEALLAAGGEISVQVLNEIAHVARRKMRMDWRELGAWLAELRTLLTVRALSVAAHDAGLALAERYQLSIYDAMMAASALEAGCRRLWSEDLQDGLLLAGRLRISNPFRG